MNIIQTKYRLQSRVTIQNIDLESNNINYARTELAKANHTHNNNNTNARDSIRFHWQAVSISIQWVVFVVFSLHCAKALLILQWRVSLPHSASRPDEILVTNTTVWPSDNNNNKKRLISWLCSINGKCPSLSAWRPDDIRQYDCITSK